MAIVMVVVMDTSRVTPIIELSLPLSSNFKKQNPLARNKNATTIEPCERELVHGIAKPPRYKIEVLMESFARLECKKKKRRSMSGIS